MVEQLESGMRKGFELRKMGIQEQMQQPGVSANKVKGIHDLCWLELAEETDEELVDRVPLQAITDNELRDR
ncbi:hypothetical protein F0562_012993 [Nyssa sinensis]|uniref:Uncharacterized protein n=1 Tax=Nyssa sinensis TaxID=561372 RepID=A0A5J4ZZW8_9ASTE|nr:hypothetical protein F0562_012993 [Nyssa sinensis]